MGWTEAQMTTGAEVKAQVPYPGKANKSKHNAVLMSSTEKYTNNNIIIHFPLKGNSMTDLNV